MTTFGDKLRDCRGRCRDPESGRSLSQERLGELLGKVLGDHGYSGQTMSNWERGNSKPGVDDRLILVGLLTVLHNCGGLQAPGDANEFLTAGNYRPLDAGERREIFPGVQAEAINQPETAAQGHAGQARLQSLVDLFFSPTAELQEKLNQAVEGPPPSWPRVVAALIRWSLDHVTPRGVLQAICWLCVSLITFWALSPSLRWPFANPEHAREAMLLFVVCSVVTPLCVGALTSTNSNDYWIQQNLANTAELRLYTHQGAFVGFYIGYMVIFLTTLAGYHLSLGYGKLFAPAIGALPVAVGYFGARLVPYNLWRAYGRMRLQDGAEFFLFLLTGPLWGYFFYQYYPLLLTPMLGLVFCLFVLCIMALMMTWRQRHAIAT
jgi:transcriptional regulator with XRE-family HTH domain